MCVKITLRPLIVSMLQPLISFIHENDKIFTHNSIFYAILDLTFLNLPIHTGKKHS